MNGKRKTYKITMNKEKLIKNGKFYNPETSELIATSTWFTFYKTQREKIYRTTKGTLFRVREIAKVIDDGHLWVHLKNGDKDALGNVTLGQHSLGTKEGGFRDDVKVIEVEIIDEMTPEETRQLFELMNMGRKSLRGNYAYTLFRFHKKYSELFEIEEA